MPKKVEENVRKKIKADKYYIDKYGDGIDKYIDIIDETIENRSWDRIYITTLFTFDYDTVIETINYAKSIIKDNSKIYVGGILATLTSDFYFNLLIIYIFFKIISKIFIIISFSSIIHPFKVAFTYLFQH